MFISGRLRRAELLMGRAAQLIRNSPTMINVTIVNGQLPTTPRAAVSCFAMINIFYCLSQW